MKCVHCNEEIKGNSQITMTTVLFYTCKCGKVVALEKSKIRALKPNEKAFLAALNVN